MMAAASIGVPMTHGSALQFNAPEAPRVSGPLQPGDFVYFRGGEPVPPRPGHTGIYVGVRNGAYTMIDAYDGREGVEYNTFIPTVTNGHDGLSYYGAIRPALLGKVGPPTPEPTLFLKTPNMTGAAVTLCQTRLVKSGLPPVLRALVRSGEKNKGIDGSFGKDTQLAVEYFQTAKELTVDGIVGAQTWGALLA
jgi:peptidoglycan hydrolase-like protein with peptidoglycan-binding domain